MTNEEIVKRNILKGCLELDVTDAGIVPYRFTRKQMDKISDEYKLRVNCTAGIRIDLETDSDFIQFKYKVLGATQDFLCFDVFLNGILVNSFSSQPISSSTGTLRYEIRHKEMKNNRITIFLPRNAYLALNDLKLSDGAYIREVSDEKGLLVCFGDSITQGNAAIRPSMAYPVLLSKFLGMSLLNQGIGGHVYDAGLLDASFNFKPDVITIAYGTNDWARGYSLDEIRRNCEAFLNRITELFPGVNAYVITPIWRANMRETKACGTLTDVCSMIKEVCSAYPAITAIDGIKIVPNMPQYFGDGTLHPNEEGFLHMALNLAKEIKT